MMRHLVVPHRLMLLALVAAGWMGSAAQGASYTFVDLGAPWGESQAVGASAGTQVGWAFNAGGPAQAMLWTGEPAHPVNLHPAGFSNSLAQGASGNMQVGYGLGPDDSGTSRTQALLWQGSAASAVSLHPAGFTSSFAYGAGGNQQVGYGYGPDAGGIEQFQALLWTGSAGSVVRLHPQGFGFSHAYATSGTKQVGFGTPYGLPVEEHALLWSGTAESVIDLNPVGFDHTQAWGIWGNQQVGYGSGVATGATGGSRRYHAMLWNSSASDLVDLNPAGFTESRAYAIANGLQVGGGYGVMTQGSTHALLWSGTAPSAIDLHDFVPAGFVGSYAYGIDEQGRVAGIAMVQVPTFDQLGQQTGYQLVPHAALWVPVPEPVTLALLLGGCVTVLRRRR